MVTDLTFLKEFVSGNHQRLHSYISLYLEHAPPLLETIRQSHQRKEWRQLKQAAHSLRPMLHYMGVESLKDDVKLIEAYADVKKKRKKLPPLVARVETIIETSFQELRDYMKENPLA
ncbi:MAG TPA: Hpt domain-containing protein [Chitinophagales bacterium]|nr:Hpt domain-containing protein [Chitinophagales bacterium]